MAKFKSLLKTITVEKAGKKRKCYHNQSHSISKGDKVLEVKEGLSIKGYCSDCGLQMLDNAKAILLEFEKRLK